MNLEKLEESLPAMPDKALLKVVKRCLCQALTGLARPGLQVREMLDIVYLECQRRGKERLYDALYETVSQHPERCRIL